jgi:hypothetical protein
MEKVNFGKSTKNIPYSTPETYLKKLIGATEKFVRTLRWKALFFLNPKAKQEEKETYGFNSRRSPPVINEMKPFEDRLKHLISNVEFQKQDNNFQRQLRNNIKDIKQEKKVFIKADKTNNYYKMEPKDYEKLLEKNIQKNYKKAQMNTCEDISKEEQKLVNSIELSDRIEATAKRDAFITLKDHKPNFQNNPACRLINPTKSELGKVSKQILEKVITNTRAKNTLNLWKNTHEVLQWFKSLEKDTNMSFIVFDIVEFYPSISEELLHEAIQFATRFESLTPSEIEIIYHTKKTLLYKGEAWVKKSEKNSTFDVTMGSYDGAETCELVGLLLLSKLQKTIGQTVGLYRDDGLAAINDKPQKVEKMKKAVCKLFKEHNLKITIEANKKIVDFLDVTLDLNTNQHKPYKKPNDVPLYVNAKSNHPPAVIKAIPLGINKRLSSLSCNEKVFNDAAEEYQEALHKSGYNHKLKFQPTEKAQQKNKTRKRTRNITWFNPPFDGRVKTNIGKEFFKILTESFPKDHKLHKIFNKNTIKLSYSCMPNLKNTIDATNKEKLKQKNSNNEKKCNCHHKEECPLENQCLSSNIVYQATVKSKDKEETYIGITENTFKTRYGNHKQSFKAEKYKNQTELSKYIWKLKENNEDFKISWKIIKKAAAYNNVSKTCNLCLTEKMMILCHTNLASLNTRVELVDSCRHKSKFLTNNYH